ncbi:hypothetical protein FBU30_007053 [Linnemannia zychae]|nr:hypothetical protein FBU30_007053 [Linnemannia zychae]
MPGSIGRPKPIDKKHPLDPTLKQLLAQLDNKIRSAYLAVAMIADSSPTFDPVLYATQVVAGVNYYVKLRVTQHGWIPMNVADRRVNNNGGGGRDDGAEYIHVKIFYQEWTNTADLKGIDIRKTFKDPFRIDMPAPKA